MRPPMQGDPPIIDLDGYQRLLPVERELAWSPAATACILSAAIGLLVAVFGIVLEFGFVAVPGWGGKPVAIAIVWAGFLFCAVAVGLGRAWQFRQLARLRCPQCGGALVRGVADLGGEEQGRWGERGVYLN